MTRLLEGAADVFDAGPSAVEVTVLHVKISEMTLANEFFGRCTREGRSAPSAKRSSTLVTLPLVAQARQLGISRGRIYLPRAVPDVNLAIMRRIDELYLLYPFAGSRNVARSAPTEGRQDRPAACRNTDEADGAGGDLPSPGHAELAPGHKVYPCLLHKLAVTRHNQVWATDAPYVAMARDFAYFFAIVDWFNRRMQAW